MKMTPRGTIAIEEAVLDPSGVKRLALDAYYYAPQTSPGQDLSSRDHPLTAALLDVHKQRLSLMDAEGVEYMLLSLTSPGPQSESDLEEAKNLAMSANNWLAGEIRTNPARFGGLASLSMHNAADAAVELRRAVLDLGFFGAILNDFQSLANDARKYYDLPEFDVFWQTVQDLDVPVYLHPRYATGRDIISDGKYTGRKHLLGAGVQFHLDLSFHIYSICSSGIFDRFPKVQIVAGHLGEGIPFNLFRADHWYNKPMKRQSRPSQHDYKYYFTHNISITTSGNFSSRGLKFCIDEIGSERCLYSIDYPYDSIKEAQDWWKSIDLPHKQKDMVARENAIRLFKLPLDI